MISLVNLVVAYASMSAGLLWRGFVLSQLWLWFIVKSLGAAPITFVHGFGICTAISMCVRQNIDPKKEDFFGEDFLNDIGVSAVALAFGWVAQHWT